MPDERIRRHLARLAAELMYQRLETEYFTAKRKAAKQLGINHRFRPQDLPSNREIREELGRLADLYEGEERLGNLRAMRLEALRMMRKLERFHPRLIGSVLTGHVRKGSDIDLHLFSDSIPAVTHVLDEHGVPYHREAKRVVKHGEERVFHHVHVHDRFEVELTIYPLARRSYVFKSSITGKAIERASLRELEGLLRREYPDLIDDLETEVERLEETIDPYELFRLLLQALEQVKQSSRHHPEGDALYHSLQVFELAVAERSFDHDLQLAALLHDVGKGIDPSDHVGAGLEALEGAISPRVEFLIGHHMEAQALREGLLGLRARRRLEAYPDFEDLMLLRDLDERGRVSGRIVRSLPEAIDHLRRLEEELEA